MNKKLIMTGCLVSAAFAAWAMPTKRDLKKAQEIISDVIAADIRAVKDGSKTPPKVADAHRKLAGEASSEAERYLLLQSAFKLYARGEAYAEAADVLAQLEREISNLPPKLVVELVSKEMGRVAGSRAPRLLRQFKAAKALVSGREELKLAEEQVRLKPQSAKFNENLGIARAKLGDWPGACAAFLKAKGEVAKRVKEESGENPNWAELADFWWGYNRPDDAEDDDRRDPTVFQLHAAELYSRAIAKKAYVGMALKRARQRIAFAYPGLSHRWSFTGNLNDGVGDRELKKLFPPAVDVRKDTCFVEHGGLDAGDIDFHGAFTIEVWMNHVRGDRPFVVYDDTSRRVCGWQPLGWAEPSKFGNEKGVFGHIVHNGNGNPKTAIPKLQDVYLAISYDPAKGNRKLNAYMRERGKTEIVSCTCEFRTNFNGRTGFALGASRNHPMWGWFGQDNLSTASFDEVRLWDRALAPEEITSSAAFGGGELPLAMASALPKEDFGTPFKGKRDPFKLGQKTSVVQTLPITADCSMDFVYCPAGKFKMGYKDLPMLAPLRDVTITRPFWITRAPVSARQVKAILADIGGTSDYDFEFHDSKLTEKFVAALQRQFGVLCPAGYEIRLPTEAEYEYVAKAGLGTATNNVGIVHPHGIQNHPWGVLGLEKALNMYLLMDRYSLPEVADSGIFRDVRAKCWINGIGYPEDMGKDPVAWCANGGSLRRIPGQTWDRDLGSVLGVWKELDRRGSRMVHVRKNVLTWSSSNNNAYLVIAPTFDSLNKFTPQPLKDVVKMQAKFDLQQKSLTTRTLQLAEDVGMDFQFCPAGKFKMGYVDAPEIAPLRDVTITRPFWISKGLVTEMHLGAALNGDIVRCADAVKLDNRQQADEYVAQFQKKYGSLLPKGYVFRLPTEAEWEYVAKSGAKEAKGELFSWKHDYVKQPLKNAWGVSGMCDGVTDVCFDKFSGAKDCGCVRFREGDSSEITMLDYSKVSTTDPYFWSDAGGARTMRKFFRDKEGKGLNLKVACVNVPDKDALRNATFHLVIAPDPATLNKFEIK